MGVMIVPLSSWYENLPTYTGISVESYIWKLVFSNLPKRSFSKRAALNLSQKENGNYKIQRVPKSMHLMLDDWGGGKPRGLEKKGGNCGFLINN